MLIYDKPYHTMSEWVKVGVLSDSLWPDGLCSRWNSLGQKTGVGSCSLLQGIFPTQGSNPVLPHCRQILYQLSYQGSPGHTIDGSILGWVSGGRRWWELQIWWEQIATQQTSVRVQCYLFGVLVFGERTPSLHCFILGGAAPCQPAES